VSTQQEKIFLKLSGKLVQKVLENVKTSAARRLNAVVVNGMRVDGTLLNAISYSLMVKMLLLVDPKDQDGKMPCAM
jgi:hypothetical protein